MHIFFSILWTIFTVYIAFELTVELLARPMTKRWRPYKARVLDATLIEEDDGDGGTYRIDFAYTYVVGGKEYRGTTLRFSELFLPQQDSFVTFHKSWAEELKRRARSAQEIIVWVHPTQHNKSIVSKAIRWELVLFYIAVLAILCFPFFRK